MVGDRESAHISRHYLLWKFRAWEPTPDAVRTRPSEARPRSRTLTTTSTSTKLATRDFSLPDAIDALLATQARQRRPSSLSRSNTTAFGTGDTASHDKTRL